MWGFMPDLQATQVVLYIASVLVGACLGIYASGRVAGSKAAAVEMRLTEFEKRLEAIATAKDESGELRIGHVERRLDDGGRRISDLTSKLMLLPGTMLTVQEELARLRIADSEMGRHISDLRVTVARMEGANGHALAT